MAGTGRPAGGSARYEARRQKIGDTSAPPAPAEPSSLPATCRRHVVPHGVWPTLKELFRRFGLDQCPAFAAALSFFAIISLVPVMLIALAGLAFIYHTQQEALQQFQRIVSKMLPGGTAQGEIQYLFEQAHIDESVHTLIQTRGIAGAVGILSLLWTSIQIFVNAAPAMNAAYEVQETRGWIKLRLVALGLFVAAGLLFLLSLVPSSGPDFIGQLHIPWLGLPKPVPWFIDALFWLVALAINITMFALIFRFLPNAPTTWREAFVGGAIAGGLWELAKRAFAIYLAHFGNYNKVYGALAGLIILLLWIYYTAMILLLGAEAAALYQAKRQAAVAATPASGAPLSPSGPATAAQRRARA